MVAKRKGPGLIGTAVIVLVILYRAAYAEVNISDTGYTETKRNKVVFVNRIMSIDTGQKVFGFKTNGCAIGMIRPVTENWYSGDFFAIRVNDEAYFAYTAEDDKKENFREKTKFKIVSEKGEGRIEASQDGKQAIVTVTLSARDGDDKLFMTVRVKPYQTLKATRIIFTCYPSATYPREKLTRAVATAKRTRVLQPGESSVSITLDKEEKWIFLYDEAFDLGVETISGEKAVGGCGLSYMPAETTQATVSLGNLHIDPQFTYGPGTTEMHFVVLDFANEKSNTYGLKYMKALDVK